LSRIFSTGTGIGWDADPYPALGKLIATNGTTALFVLHPDYLRACFLEGTIT